MPRKPATSRDSLERLLLELRITETRKSIAAEEARAALNHALRQALPHYLALAERMLNGTAGRPAPASAFASPVSLAKAIAEIETKPTPAAQA